MISIIGNDFEKRILLGPNPQQCESVLAVVGSVLLLVTPGSGKTTVLVTRLGYMTYCRGVDPSNILTMTYTIARRDSFLSRTTKAN